MASKCSSAWKTPTTLTLNQKLEMIRLSEEGMSKAKTVWKLGLLYQTVGQSVNAKGKFLKKIQSATPGKQNRLTGASLVAQWLRICLPMQETRVRALVWEDPTCRRATGPVSHDCWACASGACAPQRERPRRWEVCALRWRVAPTRRN